MTAKKLKPNESMRAAYLSNMVKISDQESPSMGSIQLNDVSAKKTDEYPSNDNQDGGAKNAQSSIVDCDPSTVHAVREDGNVDLWMGRKGTDNCNSNDCDTSTIRTVHAKKARWKDNCNSNSPNIDLWNTSLIRMKKDNEKTKWNTSGWPSWETANKKSKEGDSSMACKRGWNEFEDGKAKREASEGIGVFDRGRVQGWGQSSISNHTVDKGSLSKPCWNRGEDGNEKKKDVGWPNWDGARSKYSRKYEYGNTKSGTRECDSFNRDGTDGWRQYKYKINIAGKGSSKTSVHWNRSKDGHAKKKNVGRSSWDGACSKPIKQYAGHQNGGGWNQSRGSVVLEEGTTLEGKGGWHESEDGSGKKESGVCPSWDGAGSKTIGNSSWKQSQGWRGSEDTTMACTRGWNDSKDVKEKRKASEGGDDRCQQSNMVEKGSSSNSCWEKKEDGKGNKEIDGWQSWGRSMSKTIKDSPRSQNKSTEWSRSLTRTGSDHDDFRKEDGARNSDCDQREDPWMQRSTGIPSKCDWNKCAGWNSSKGDGLDRNRWKQSPGLDQTGGDPWKQHCPNKSQKDCGEKSGSWAAPGKSCFRKEDWSSAPCFCNPDASKQHGSRLGRGSDQSAPNFENTGRVSMLNDMKIHDSTAGDELGHSHTMIGGCFKSMADHDAYNSHVCKTQQNYCMSQQTLQNTLSPSDVQNDGFADSTIQFAQNVQANFQLLPSPKSSNPNGQIQDHEQPAMSDCKLNKQNDDIPCQRSISSSDPVSIASVQDNEGSSSTNFPSRSRSSPISIKASKTSEELKASTNELTPSERNPNTSSSSAKKMPSGNCDPCHRQHLDDKGVRMFKFALAEFVKKILKPTWKEGGLSLEAHRTVVKKVVDKVIRVLGSNVPRTQEMIDRYMSYANDKLNKLTQDYLEMFINT